MQRITSQCLEIRGREGGGGGVSKKKNVWPQFGLEIRGGTGPPAPPLDPSLLHSH